MNRSSAATYSGPQCPSASGRYIIEQTQSRQRGLDVIAKIEEQCRRHAEFPEGRIACPDLEQCERVPADAGNSVAICLDRCLMADNDSRTSP